MPKLPILAFALASAVLAVAPAHAQTPVQTAVKTGPGSTLPSIDAVLSQYESFLGGKAALARVTTRTTVTRRIEFSDHPSDAVLTRLSKRPMSSIMRHEALDGTFIRYMNGCDGQGGWVGYGRAGDPPVPRAGKAATDGVCEEEQYYYEYLPLDMGRLRRNVKSFEVRAEIDILPLDPGSYGRMAGGRGPDLVPAGPRRVYLVFGAPARDGDPAVWLYFDKQTGALLRRSSAGPGDHPVLPGQADRYTDFLQYREVGDGTRAPFQFATVSPNSEVRGISLSVTDNAPLGDELFTRPRDVSRADKGL
jgi:hypothetical protein